ncbi:hypothetical protein PSTT_03369 [Puccinia striiformis]|uniref:Uncharacterized protein n=1 Tax=Puccinia striiformis TaxID=27350 RepID=A0A2S4VWZ3_9BASI|nr:hypothetical protein PSTT_03369 [Puccinia striiformis]
MDLVERSKNTNPNDNIQQLSSSSKGGDMCARADNLSISTWCPPRVAESCGLSLNSTSSAQHPKPAGGAALANVLAQQMGSAGNGNNINRLCFPHPLPSPNCPTSRACTFALPLLNSTIKAKLSTRVRWRDPLEVTLPKIYRMLQLHQLARKSRIYRRLLRRESKKDLPFHTKSKMIALQDLAEKGFAPQTPSTTLGFGD